jgi:hypothetical protein
MRQLLDRQAEHHVVSLAQTAILRAEIRATLRTCEELSSRLRSAGVVDYSPTEEFLKLRREQLEETLISLENVNPEVAALVQKAIDDASL